MRFQLRFCLAVLLNAGVASFLSGCGDNQSPTTSTSLSQMGGTHAEIREAVQNTDPAETVHLLFSVKLSDPDGLDDYIRQMFDPESPNFHKTLSSTEIMNRFGPTKGQVQKLIATLNARGFKNVKVSDNRMLAEADASVAQVQTTFNTSLKNYKLDDGTIGHRNETPSKLPNDVSELVSYVYGLDTVSHFKTHSVSKGQIIMTTSAVAPPGNVVGHNPLEFKEIYHQGSTSGASNISVAIIGWGNMQPSITDLRKFEQVNGLSSTPVSMTTVGNPGTSTVDQAEWSLDSQSIVSMAGGLAQLKFYAAQDNTPANVINAINQAIQDTSKAQIINMSFGFCDNSTNGINYDGSIMKIAVAQGQTLVASTGDAGSSCSTATTPLPHTTSYPATSAFVVAVGGTTLGTSGTTYSGETAWSRSGGGISQSVVIPPWQAAVSALSGTTYRGVPDISMVGDPDSGAQIWVNGTLTQVGGTSLAAPLFAATWGRMLQSCGTNLGFPSPTLYEYVNRNVSAFHDITSGSNGDFSAAPGWDKVTGLGSIDIDNLRVAVCPGAPYVAATEELYLSYLGRPAEPSGLAYWSSQLKNANAPTTVAGIVSAYGVNSAVTALVDSLSSSAESQALYNSTDTSTYVTLIYNNLLNRAPDSAGLSYWVQKINSGVTSRKLAPLAILGSALTSGNNDAVLSGNKFAVATNFTSTLTTTQSPYYSGATANASARKLLKNVYLTADAADFDLYYEQRPFVSKYQSSVVAAINAIVSGTPY